MSKTPSTQSNGNGVKVNVSVSGKAKGTHKYAMIKDVASKTRAELAKECRRVFDIANKRINRLNSSGLMSPALHSVLKEGKFYAKGADLHKLQHEYARCISFLNMDTSTVSGARKYEKHIEKIMGGKLSTAQKSVLFDAFRRIKEVSPAGLMSYGSDRLISYLADEIRSEDDNINAVDEPDFKGLVEKAMNEVTAAYEKAEAEFSEMFKDSLSF